MKKKVKLFIGIIGLGLLICGLVGAIYFYRLVYAPNIDIPETEAPFLYIKTGWDQEYVIKELEKKGWLNSSNSLRWLMKKKNYQGKNVVSGKYRLRDGMNNTELMDQLRAGRGELEVELTFNNIRTPAELAGALAAQIEPDSLALINLLNDPEVARRYGFSKEAFISMFLPDTYYVWWDISAEELFQRMATEYKKFWTEARKQKAAELGLTQSEVATLASIVQAEQLQHPEERARIAGLYLNRLERNMPLQSDPTVVYALGDFSLKRVLREHLQTNHPYNTYKIAGLPPGPVNLPEKSTLDAVLNPENHNYLYMCAKADFSGLHAFSTNLAQHNLNARKYQAALNKRKIY